MSRKSGKIMRILGRLFRERQIYHRSDGVVRFIKLSMRTQVALASVTLFALCWIAYASVNVVFKEQIILAKDKERRSMDTAYRRKLSDAQQAYDEINTLNVIFSQEFDAAISQLENRHETLRAIVNNKRTLDDDFEALSQTLSTIGDPNGNKLSNGNRIMVDAVGREPTPRQSREARISEEALNEVMADEIAAGLENTVLSDMRVQTAELSARQMVLMASVEEEVRVKIAEISRILDYTGVDSGYILAKASISKDKTKLAQIDYLNGQGGPNISAENTTGTPSIYYQSASRIAASMQELNVLASALKSVPLATPINRPHRKTSGFGLRHDPVSRGRYQQHFGLDMAAAWRSPILATAPGVVEYAGNRYNGYGNMVEIDHGNGFITRYAHMDSLKVRTGDTVGLHDVIGYLGNTGRSTGPHCHDEIIYQGKQIDPMRFIEAGRYVFES